MRNGLLEAAAALSDACSLGGCAQMLQLDRFSCKMYHHLSHTHRMAMVTYAVDC